jgi:hypothetical protein
VKPLSSIRALLWVLALVGLVLAPLAQPVMAMTGGAQTRGIVSAQSAMNEAAMTMSGMPCCPEKAPLPDCSRDCPFMMLCAGSAFCGAQGAELIVSFVLSDRVSVRNDTDVVSLSHRPSPRPPKF